MLDNQIDTINHRLDSLEEGQKNLKQEQNRLELVINEKLVELRAKQQTNMHNNQIMHNKLDGVGTRIDAMEKIFTQALNSMQKILDNSISSINKTAKINTNWQLIYNGILLTGMTTIGAMVWQLWEFVQRVPL